MAQCKHEIYARRKSHLRRRLRLYLARLRLPLVLFVGRGFGRDSSAFTLGA